MDQLNLGASEWALKKKVTRRAQFLSEMEAVIPWPVLQAVIEPHYPTGSTGRPPHPLMRMLRIYFMQQWFNLSDPGMEDALYEMESMRHFAQIDVTKDVIPDETTILRFRHLLEQHQLTEGIFKAVRGLLEKKGLMLKSGTIVDATIIEAPPSTKNAEGARDPEMHQTRKGKDWHFGMKLHVGTTPNKGWCIAWRRVRPMKLTSVASTSWFTAKKKRFTVTRPTGPKGTANTASRPASATVSTGAALEANL